MRWVRRGHSYREAARRWQVSVHTVARWVQRARGRELIRMNWADRPRGNRHPAWRTPARVVQLIVRARRRLQTHDALGEHGAEAIRRWLQQAGQPAPSARTIARILARQGLSGKERWRRPPPPKGWYLPEVAGGRAEMDQIDIVEGLQLRGATTVEVLNALSLWGRLAASWPQSRVRTEAVLQALREHWQQWGRPDYLQCDNDTVFSGAHARRTYLGRLVHWCLCVGVTPVFTPPYEFGFQAGIEAYNRRWQERVWRRWRHRHHAALRKRSTAFVQAYIERQDSRQPAPARRAWQGEMAEVPTNSTVQLLRRLDDRGAVTLFAQSLKISAHWAHRLVRCEVSVSHQLVRIYALQRRNPTHQPLLATRKLNCRLVPWHI